MLLLLRGTTEHPNSYHAGRLKSIGSKRNRPTFEMSANAFRLKPWQLNQVDHSGKLNWGSLVVLPAVLLTYQVDPRILGLLDELKGQNFQTRTALASKPTEFELVDLGPSRFRFPNLRVYSIWAHKSCFYKRYRLTC